MFWGTSDVWCSYFWSGIMKNFLHTKEICLKMDFPLSLAQWQHNWSPLLTGATWVGPIALEINGRRFSRGPVYKEQFYINSQIWCHYPLCQSINWRICFSIITSNLMARRKGLGDMLNLLFTHLLEWFLRSSISQQWPNLQSYTSIGVGFRCILLETRNVTRHLEPV